jgi:hypothetical protein
VINATVGGTTEGQNRIGLVGVLDARPAVVRIVLPEVRQVGVDGVGVEIDEP